MKTKDGFIQGYNAQAAVDATAQVIVAHGLDAKQSDQHQLAPIVDAIEANLSKKPKQLSADAGYCSDANLAAMQQREIDAYIAPGRAKHAGEGEGGGTRVAAMREKIKAGGHASPYRLRKQLPEPVFGQARLLWLLPDPMGVHSARSVDSPKIAVVSLAAVANRAKPLQGATPSRRRKIPGSGCGWFTHRSLAYVRTPGGPTSPAQRLFQLPRSSPNLCARPSLTRSNRRDTDPYARWCGRGGVARRPPIPINPQELRRLERSG